jgi:hypothetical protein
VAYWRRDPSAWPAQHLLLGEHDYAARRLMELLGGEGDDGASRGVIALSDREKRDPSDAQSLSLARELIAAKFNLLIGASIPRATALVASADSAIGDRSIPFSSGRHHSPSEILGILIDGLGDYNDGELSPGCVSKESLAPDLGHGEVEASAPIADFVSIGPNPFRTSTRLAIGLSREKSLRVLLLDLQGREVRRFHDGPLGAGVHEFTWNGNDDNGQSLGNGVYFLRVDANGPVIVRKILLVR